MLISPKCLPFLKLWFSVTRRDRGMTCGIAVGISIQGAPGGAAANQEIFCPLLHLKRDGETSGREAELKYQQGVC